MEQRIAKVIAARGYCSRRDAEKLILEGLVEVNGKIIESPALNVSENAIIRIKGKLLEDAEAPRLFKYHKPTGVITTHKDPQGRTTLFEILPKGLPRLISVGRLDLNSEGLILLTTSGELARKLEHPKNALIRRYRVRAYGMPPQDMLEKLKKGVTSEGIHYDAIDATIDRQNKQTLWLTMNLTEGKNREIRKVLAHFGLQVTRLIRVSYGPFDLGPLEPGHIEEISPKTMKKLLGE